MKSGKGFRFTVVLALLAIGAGVILWKRRSGEPVGNQPQASRPAAKPSASVPWNAPTPESVPPVFDSDPVGALAISGVVMGPDGQPVAGAQVTLSSTPPRSSKSDENGRFRFAQLLDRQYKLVARKDDLAGGPLVVSPRRDSEVVLNLARALRVSLRALSGSARKPVAGATFELRGSVVLTAVSDQDGRATVIGVLPGDWTLAAWAPKLARQFMRLSVAEGSTSFEVFLQEGASITGRVIDDTGAPVAGAFVSYERTAESFISSEAMPDPSRDGAVTGTDGGFTLANLVVGSYRFTARHAEYAPTTTPPKLVDGRSPIEITLDRGTSLAGTVKNREGGVVPGATVMVTPRRLRREATIPREASADSEGRFSFSALSPGEVDVAASHTSGGSGVITMQLAKGKPNHVDIVLDKDRTIAGVVLGPDRQPVAGAQVAAFPDMLSGNREENYMFDLPSAITDGAGEFTLTSVGDGAYRLRAAPAGGAMRPRRLRPSDPVGRAGDRHLRILLPSTGGLKGSVAYEDGTAPPSFLVSFEDAPPRPFTSGDGTFEIRGIEPVQGSLTISGGSFNVVTRGDVVVRSGEVTELGQILLVRGRRVSGKVLKPDGEPIAGATVFLGNRLVANGSQLTTISWSGGGANATKQATSDADGRFSIDGYGFRDAALIADHPAAGRSRTVKVPPSRDSMSIDLVIEPTAALEGIVTKKGEPPGTVRINLSPTDIANNSNFVVETGPEGRFRFDRLSEGEYQVSVMRGATPIGGVNQRARKTVMVKAGTVATVELAMDEDDLTIRIAPRLPDGTGPKLSEIHLVSGQLPFQKSADLRAHLASQNAGFSAFLIEITGQPGRLKAPPGQYTACVVPYPRELSDKGVAAVRSYVDKHVDDMPVFCRPIEVRQNDQTFDVPIMESSMLPD
jgi:hypothetical protein